MSETPNSSDVRAAKTHAGCLLARATALGYHATLAANPNADVTDAVENAVAMWGMLNEYLPCPWGQPMLDLLHQARDENYTIGTIIEPSVHETIEETARALFLDFRFAAFTAGYQCPHGEIPDMVTPPDQLADLLPAFARLMNPAQRPTDQNGWLQLEQARDREALQLVPALRQFAASSVALIGSLDRVGYQRVEADLERESSRLLASVQSRAEDGQAAGVKPTTASTELTPTTPPHIGTRESEGESLSGPAGEILPALLSATDLARKLGCKPKSVGTFLTRFAVDHRDCRVEVPSPRKNEPDYFYRVSDVWPALQQWARKNRTGMKHD